MIGSIIVGALAGWIASMIMKRNDQMGGLANIIVGLIGGVIGNFVMSSLGFQLGEGFVNSLATGIIGAVILLAIYGAVTKK